MTSTESSAVPTDDQREEIDDSFKEMEPIKDAPIVPAHGIAAVALNMAIKYHDMGMIKDGALYQQYKLEGRNIHTLALAEVFETAIKIENHLLGASERIAKIIVDALEIKLEGDPEQEAASGGSPVANPQSNEEVIVP